MGVLTQAAALLVALASSGLHTAGGKIPKPTPRAAGTCGPAWNGDEYGVAWAEKNKAKPGLGLEFFFARFTTDGERIGEIVKVGWGLHAEAACAIAFADGEYAVSWPHYDEADNDATLWFVTLSAEGALGKEKKLEVYGKLGDHVPKRLTPVPGAYKLVYLEGWDRNRRTIRIKR